MFSDSFRPSLIDFVTDDLWKMDSCFPTMDKDIGRTRMHVLSEWSPRLKTTLDTEQKDALKHILSKQVAVIQGPPGTGKVRSLHLAFHPLIVSLCCVRPSWLELL